MDRMTPYGPEHLAVLVVIVVVGILAVVHARRVRGTPAEHRLTRGAGWLLLVVSLLWMAWGLLPQNWDIEQSLPFHFSDALRIITAIALITRAGWAVAVSFYWGLTLNLQSVLTPDLTYLGDPVLEFSLYWFLHAMVLWAPLVLVWGLGYRPTWRGYAAAFGIAVGWAGVAAVANAVTGANYAYLAHAPAGPSLLDVLGGWPWYIGVEFLLVGAVWALMTWPFTTTARTEHAPLADRWGLVRRRAIPAAAASPTTRAFARS